MKIPSLKSELVHLQSGIFTVQETHYKKKGNLKINDWEIFEAIRKKEFGGSMIGVHKGLNPILIQEYNGDFELIVVEAIISDREVRIISGYGPQECWPVEERLPFFHALEEEITKAGLAGKSIIVSFDANSKLGPEWIPNDRHKQSPNGAVLAGIIKRHALVVANSLKGKSSGVITRNRTTVDGDEKSTIDFVIISSDMVDKVVSVKIDEDKTNCLTSITKSKNGTRVIKSDHNTIITNLQVNWNKKVKKDKLEIFNFKNIEGQRKFKELTSRQGKFTDIFIDETRDIESVTKKFLKNLDGCFQQSFKKVRVDHKEKNKLNDLFNKRRILRTKHDEESKKELNRVEEELSEQCAEENYKKDQRRNKRYGM